MFAIILVESSTTNSDGIFLVRESATSENSYVLSVYFDSEFYHYQIQQHSEDSFFSIDGLQPIHGIECLIDHYRKSKSNLCTQLGNFVKKSAPPIAIRRHGTSNLLHRATKKNQLTVVKEMMKTTYRNLDAKDESGMTAVHLACKYRCDLEILKLLIERGAAVSTRDSSGNTPLHVSADLFVSNSINISVFLLFSSALQMSQSIYHISFFSFSRLITYGNYMIEHSSMHAKVRAKKWSSCSSTSTKT